MTSKSHHLLAYVLMVGATVVANGCEKNREGPVDTVMPQTTSIASTDTATKDMLLANYKAVVDEAKTKYDYEPGAGRPPIAAQNPKDFLPDRYSTADPGNIVIWTATPKAGPPPKYDIRGKIESDIDLPKFGIHQDTSYLWLKPGKDKTEPSTLYIVHATFPWSHKALQDSWAFGGGPHPEVHLVRATMTHMVGINRVNEFAFGVCIDDCPTGHCGYQ